MADAGWSGLFGGYRGKNFGNDATAGQAGGNMLGGGGLSGTPAVVGTGPDGNVLGDLAGAGDVTDIHASATAPALNAPGTGGVNQNALNAVNSLLAGKQGGVLGKAWAQPHAMGDMSQQQGAVGDLQSAGASPITEKGPAGPIPTTTNPPTGGPFAGLPPGGTTGTFGNGQPVKPTPNVPQTAPGPAPTSNTPNGPGGTFLPPNDMGNDPAKSPYASGFKPIQTTGVPGGAGATPGPFTPPPAPFSGLPPGGTNVPYGANGPFGKQLSPGDMNNLPTFDPKSGKFIGGPIKSTGVPGGSQNP
jgi:hypothetical protein